MESIVYVGAREIKKPEFVFGKIHYGKKSTRIWINLNQHHALRRKEMKAITIEPGVIEW